MFEAIDEEFSIGSWQGSGKVPGSGKIWGEFLRSRMVSGQIVRIYWTDSGKYLAGRLYGRLWGGYCILGYVICA